MRAFLGAIAMLAPVPALALGQHDMCRQELHCRVASDAELAGLRGGFEVDTRAGRLRVDIGITRAVAVNDRLVAVSRLEIPANGRALVQDKALIVQIGPGNFAPPAAAFHGAALPTIVQNTLDNQNVKTFTLLDASLNCLSIMNVLRMGEMMRRATAASGR